MGNCCHSKQNLNKLNESEKAKLERIELGLKRLEKQKEKSLRLSKQNTLKNSSLTTTTLANSSQNYFTGYQQEIIENKRENLKLTKQIFLNKFHLQLEKDVGESDLMKKRRNLRYWSENVISNKQSPQLKELLNNKNRKLSIQLNYNQNKHNFTKSSYFE